MKRNIWALDFSAHKLLLLPAAIGVNYIGKLLAQLLNLPFWLDSIGTLLASMLGGPIIGALSGIINNVLYGILLDPVSFVYGLTSAAMGLLVGGLSYKGFLVSWKKVLIMSVFVALAAALVSTPLNMIFWGGETGIAWADSFLGMAHEAIPFAWLGSFLAELFVDVPDKVICVILSYLLYKSLPKNILKIYERETVREKRS